MNLFATKITLCFFLVTICLTGNCLSNETATAEEVYSKVFDAVGVLENLGEEGLNAFNDPKGEFLWKDTYVIVFTCDKMIAHPNPKLIGMPADKVKCHKTGRLIIKEGCQGISKNGFWLEFWYPKIGEEGIFRKLMFAVPVEGTDWIVAAGTYDETTIIAELNATLK